RLSEFFESLGQILFGNWFAVPAVTVLQHRNAFSLESLRHNRARLGRAVAAATVKGVEDFGIIVAIHCKREPSKRPELACKPIDAELVHRSLALAQAVNVDHGVKV